MKHYLSFDVGWSNLAFVYCTVDETTHTIETILQADRVNLKEIPHQRVLRSVCTLMHSADAHDLMQHFFQEYGTQWPIIDVVLIERQPQGGLVHIEQILYGQWRSKAQLVAPRSMHKHFQINHLDYDQRKQKTTALAQPYLQTLPQWNIRADRLHDMADAMCLILYHLEIQKSQNIQNNTKPILDLNQFVFQPVIQLADSSAFQLADPSAFQSAVPPADSLDIRIRSAREFMRL